MARIKGSIIRPKNGVPADKPDTSAIEIVNQIEEFHPGVLEPDDPIYVQALEQYNNAIAQGTTVRLAVPKGFCGYIDPSSGEYRVIPDPDITILKNDQAVTLTDAQLSAIGNDPISYPIDKCLTYGLPGTLEYTTCPGSESIETVSGIEWDNQEAEDIIDEAHKDPPGQEYGNLTEDFDLVNEPFTRTSPVVGEDSENAESVGLEANEGSTGLRDPNGAEATSARLAKIVADCNRQFNPNNPRLTAKRRACIENKKREQGL